MHKQVTIFNGALRKISFTELKDSYDLLKFLVIRDVKILYKQTVLGFSWAILRPLVQMVIFTLIFGVLARVPNDGIPYPVFYLSGLVPWIYFQTALGKSSTSLVSNSAIFTKVYFPRLILPITPLIASFLDFIISFVFLIAMMLFYGIYPGVNFLIIPILLVIMFITIAGMGFWFSALAVLYRDVNHAMQFVLQLLMYLSPVIWPVSIINTKFGSDAVYYRVLYGIYPMGGIIEGLRSALFNTEIPWDLIITGLISGLLIFVTGIKYFKNKEKIFADVV